MIAYIYIPKEKKYDKVDINLLTNFDYEAYKNNEQCTIYKGKTLNGKKFKCQLLLVADSQKQLDYMIERKRIRVPKLNQSVLESSVSIENTNIKSNIINEKKKRKCNKNLQIDTRTEVEKKIVGDFCRNSPVSSYANAVLQERISDLGEINNDDNNNIQSSHNDDTNKQRIHDDNTSIQSLHNKIENMEKEITNLKEKYDKQKQKANMYYNKYKDLKHSKNFPLTEKAGQYILTLINKCTDTERTVTQPVNKNIMQHESEADNPEDTVLLDNEIQKKKSGFEMAFQIYDPSKFVITLCYTIWGYETLANRCVKNFSNKERRQVVTPKKVEVLREAFKNWLTTNGYEKQAFKNELKHMNIYISRAITGARRHLKLDVPKIPNALPENICNVTQPTRETTDERNDTAEESDI